MFTFNRAIVSFLRLILWRVPMFLTSSIVLITTKESFGTSNGVLRVNPLISGNGLRVSQDVRMVWRVTMALRSLYFVVYLYGLVIGVGGLCHFNMGNVNRPTSPVPMRFAMKGTLLSHLQNVYFRPNGGTTFFEQLKANELDFTLLYVKSNLFNLPSVFLRALFLDFLLLIF